MDSLFDSWMNLKIVGNNQDNPGVELFDIILCKTPVLMRNREEDLNVRLCGPN